MSSTITETFASDVAAVRTAPIETIRATRFGEKHFTRMGGVYAWALVTVAIFFLAGVLASMEDSRAAAGSEVGRVDSVSSVETAR